MEDGVMRNQKGFSLIELLIVVAIILIIAAIAIPNLVRSRMRANEANAVASLRVIHTSAVTYNTTYPDLGYPASLLVLSGPNPCSSPSSTQACLIDSALASGVKDGYSFVWTGDGLTPSYAFLITGTPQAIGASGQNMFCTDQTGVIRYDPTGSGCTSASLAIN
jgi:prepilin-type N-terminal cleavage/methylation domain-containing protein